MTEENPYKPPRIVLGKCPKLSVNAPNSKRPSLLVNLCVAVIYPIVLGALYQAFLR